MAFITGGGGGGRRQQMMQQPAAPAPTPAPPPPDRSDAEIREAAIAQRRKYGLAGLASTAMATGGMGVPVSSTYSAVTALLGGGTGA